MSDPPDFRLEHSELRGDDEFAEFSNVDLPYYSDWRGSFEKLAVGDRRRVPRGGAAPDVAIVGAPLRRRRLVATRRAVRPTCDPHGADGVEPRVRVVDPARRGAVRAPHGRRRRRRPGRSGAPRTRLRVIHEKVYRVASVGCDPDRARRRSLHHVSERGRGIAPPACPRSVGIVHFDAHADTGADQWGNLVRPRHSRCAG